MQFGETLVEWLRSSVDERPRYLCRECGATLAAPQSDCPDCGGDVEKLPSEPTDEYWGPLG